MFDLCRTGVKRKKEDGEGVQRVTQNGGVLALTSLFLNSIQL